MSHAKSNGTDAVKRLTILTPILVISMILSSCSYLPSMIAPDNQRMTWRQRQSQIKRFTSWHAKGAIAVKQGKKGFTARMQWQQSAPKVYLLSLYGPLGSGHVTLKGGPGGVTMTDNKTKKTAKDGEALLRQQTGYTVPVNNFYYWVRGLPAPSSHAELSHDRYGHLVKLIQSGWQVNYLKYTAYKGIDLPAKIVMTRDNIKVKVIINQWSR